MNRRTMLLAMGASALPLPALASPTRRYILESGFARDEATQKVRTWAVTWEGEAMRSPHAKLVRDWIKKTTDEGVLYCAGDYFMDRTVRLGDTRFVVRARGKVWNYLTGYTDEDGLEITITEGGAQFAPIGILETEGNSIGIPERYYVRKPLLRYDEDRELRFALGDNREGYSSPNSKIGFDMRWLQRETAKAGVTL